MNDSQTTLIKTNPFQSGWWRRWGEETFAAYAFLLPSILVFIIFTFFPVIFSIVASFLKWNLPYKASFTGVENYTSLINGPVTSPIFWQSVGNTFYFMLGIPINMILALFIAISLNRRLPGVAIFRTAFFLPTITSMAAVSVVWMWLYHPADYGLFNSLLIELGVPVQRWLRDPALAMPCLILMGVWHGMGYNIVIFLAGLQAIPRELYEVAEIDGAGTLAKFIYVTWPQLSPTTFYILVIGVINSLQAFTEIDVMTQGGPLNVTTTLAYYLYQEAFQYFRIGMGSSVAVILFILLLALTLLQFRGLESKVYYE
ncbi:MAG: sugar ABC transporter permease [Anaerolineales bacterium]|nr:sugar ABC transporter permease [Anaerolineales bacterium]